VINQDDELGTDEYVFRRVLNRPDIIDLSLREPLQRSAFRPTNDDVYGISVFRELFTSAEELISLGNSESGYYVVRLPVQDILNAGLQIIPDPQEGQPLGHALIPSITVQDYKNKQAKNISRLNQKKLSDIVNKNVKSRIVLSPLKT